MSTPTPAPLMLSVSGCRGIFGKTMTPEVAARFAMVAGGYFKERAKPGARPLVVLARDGRAAGEHLARAAASGLCAAGCDCLDLGVAMTPTVGVMVDIRGAAGGLVLTASHNPQQWNGLKPMIRECRETDGPRATLGAVSASAPAKSFADDLIARYRAAEKHGAQGVDVEHVGSVTAAPTGAALGMPSEGTFAHIQRVKAALQSIGVTEDRRWQAIRAVVDSVNSSGRESAKHFLGNSLAHHLGDSDSGLFPHPPEPTRENLGTLCRFVAEKRADVGFAQDPDADRLALVDEKGHYIGEEYTLVLCAEAILGSGKVNTQNAAICINLSTSRMIEDVAAKYGARVLRTAVGEANVVEAMKRENAPFGGEGNGGFIWPKVTYIRDSLSSMALVMALLARTGKTLSQLVAEVPAYAIVKRKVDLTDMSQAARAVEAIAKAYAKEKLDRQDGVRVDLASERAWLHVRGSNTEPIMRLIAEAPTEQVANQILDNAAAVIARG